MRSDAFTWPVAFVSLHSLSWFPRREHLTTMCAWLHLL